MGHGGSNNISSSTIMVFTGTIGDLTESLIKRISASGHQRTVT
jgi:hypothetical protein